MSIPCEVIRDLLPLVQDGVASEESCRVVQEHLRQCEHCRQAQPPISEQPEESLDRKILRSVRKTSFGLGFALLLAGTVLGSLLTGTSIGVFYNFLIMPALGVLGFWMFRKKCLTVPIGVFVISFLLQFPESGWYGWFYSFLFALFSVVGIGIAGLLRYAFGREENQ